MANNSVVTSVDTMVQEALEALLQEFCTPALVREVESASDPRAAAQGLWQQLEASGLPDAALTEELGGAGLALDAVGALLELCGRFAVPLPLGETILARAFLSQAHVPIPRGSIALGEDAHLSLGRTADWVLLEIGSQWLLLPITAEQLKPASFCLDAHVTWTAEQCSGAAHLNAPAPMRRVRAMLYAAQLGGAAMRVFEQTLQFANDREQFGRPIGKFQAIQHQLSVLAEHAFAARMCRQMACQAVQSGLLLPDLSRVAIAKARASEAALEIAQLSHSIHGAIGFTREFDLQLFTRRLHAWRQAAGAEGWWQMQLGRALLDANNCMAVEFICDALQPFSVRPFHD
jgi:acyl-CoA dehydrogenase